MVAFNTKASHQIIEHQEHLRTDRRNAESPRIVQVSQCTHLVLHNQLTCCSISLDPDDEDSADNQLFIGLLNFLDNDLTIEERSNFLNKTLQNMVNRALELKKHKPRGGLHFSLQQQRKVQSRNTNYSQAHQFN